MGKYPLPNEAVKRWIEGVEKSDKKWMEETERGRKKWIPIWRIVLKEFIKAGFTKKEASEAYRCIKPLVSLYGENTVRNMKHKYVRVCKLCSSEMIEVIYSFWICKECHIWEVNTSDDHKMPRNTL